MSVANTDQAERWNSGEDLAHWIDNQARYDRTYEPFTALMACIWTRRCGSSGPWLDTRLNSCAAGPRAGYREVMNVSCRRTVVAAARATRSPVAAA